jgi:hypothetical protein
MGQASLVIAAYQVRMLTRTAELVRRCVAPDLACSPITAMITSLAMRGA